MLKNGNYVAWFKTPSKPGTGVIHLLDGSITGGDSILSYSGAYQVRGDDFTAILKTTRHAKGHESVFGADNLTLRLEGKAGGRMAKFIGRADEFPHTPFEGTLIYSEQEQQTPDRETPAFDPKKLPKSIQSR